MISYLISKYEVLETTSRDIISCQGQDHQDQYMDHQDRQGPGSGSGGRCGQLAWLCVAPAKFK